METLEQFTERMSQVEFSRQYVMGQACYGDTRSVYIYEGQTCFLESRGFRTVPKRGIVTPARMLFAISGEPKEWWIHSKDIYGKGRAKKIANHYGAADIDECPYCNVSGVWFFLIFENFEALMKMVYDIHTGKFVELWGKIEEEQNLKEIA